MNNKTLIELQYLQEKLANKVCLTPADIQTLELAQTVDANSAQHIYLLIADPTNPHFYEFLNTVKPYPHIHSQIMSLTEDRLRKEWNHMDQSHKEDLEHYLKKSIRKNNEEDANLLIHFNKILVLMSVLEWKSVYQKVVCSIRQNGARMQLSNHNHLEKFRYFLEKGYHIIKELFSPLEYKNFQTQFNTDLRNIINMLCSSLKVQMDQCSKINNLNLVLHVANRASPFELITTGLIEQLAIFIGEPEYRQFLIIFFQKIFAMAEITSSNSSKQYQSDNLQRIVQILEAYLKKCQEKVQENLSFWRTKDLINLLFVFLPRYLSYAVNITIWGTKDLQLDHPVSHFYSVKFNTFIGQIYWRLVKFLLSTIVNLDTYHNLQKDLSFQFKKKFLCCSRLLLAIRSQLPLNDPNQAEYNLIQIMIYQCVHTCTPIITEFLNFYRGQDLIKDKNVQSLNCKEEYNKFIKTVLVDQMYRSYFFKLLTDSTFLPRDINVKMTKQQVEGVISTMNARIWSHILANRVDPITMKQLADFHILKTLTKCNMPTNQIFKILQPCIHANSLFLLQISYPYYTSFKNILQRFQINNEVMQYLLVTVSKICARNEAAAKVDFGDLRLIIQKLHQLEMLPSKSNNLLTVYLSIIKVLVEKTKEEKSQVQQMMRDLIGNQIDELPMIMLINQNTDHPEPIEINLLKRLESISHFFIKEFEQSQSTAKITSSVNTIFIVNQIRTMIIAIITKLRLKRQHIGKQIREDELEDIQQPNLYEFCRLYVQVSRCFIAMSCFQRSKENSGKLDILKIVSIQKQEFTSQTHFKQKEYLWLSLEYYNWAKKNEFNFSEIANVSISEIAKFWADRCELSKEYLCFWKKISTIIGQKLNETNYKHIQQVLDIFFQESNNFGGIIDEFLELSYQLMNTQRTSLLHKLLLAIFSIFFLKGAQEQHMFNRISRLFDSLMKKCNPQFAKIWIQQRIPQTSQLKANKDHQMLLEKALREGGLACREYIFFVKRTKAKLF